MFFGMNLEKFRFNGFYIDQIYIVGEVWDVGPN